MASNIYYAQDAIDELASQIKQEDLGTSSHWRQMHSAFSYSDGRLSGLRGFGAVTSRSNILRRFAHRLLQSKWRQLGHPFPDFHRVDKIADSVARLQGRIYDLDVLRQALTVAYLRDKVPEVFAPGKVVLTIGDGFGTLSSIILKAFPGVKVIVINLVKTLLVDLLFIRKSLPEVRFALVTNLEAMTAALADKQNRVIALRADDWELLKHAPATLAVNIASMQEMNPRVIGQYFQALRAMRSKVVFYCCNREEKVLPDGTMVRFEGYAWQPGDKLLDDELCPWHQEYYSARPPFFHRYDGPLRHRLAFLASGGQSFHQTLPPA